MPIESRSALCGNCKHFVAGGLCELVKGQIKAKDTCDLHAYGNPQPIDTEVEPKYNKLKVNYKPGFMVETVSTGDVAQKAIQMEHELLSRGIPEEEVHRAVIAYFSAREPPYAMPWPGPVTGLDLAGRVNNVIVPDTGEPTTYFQGLPKDVQPYPTSNVSPYGIGSSSQPYQSFFSPAPNSVGSLSNVYDVLNPPYPYESESESANWLGLASDPNSEPSMHGEHGFNVAKAIPEWRYPVEQSQMYPLKIPDIIIPPSGTNPLAEAKKEEDKKKSLGKLLLKWALLLGGIAGINKILDSLDPDKPLEIFAKYTAKLDDKTCPECRKANGDIFNLIEMHRRPVLPSENLGYTTRHPNCYSDDTEVYTDQGWKLFKELDKTEKFLSLNSDTEDLEFVKAIDYVNYISPTMISFKNRWNSLLVTPNHNMLIRTRNIHKPHFKKARDVSKWDLIPRSSKWKGKDIKTVKINDLEINAETFCAFMGYWLSEGSVTHRHKNSYQIKISQYKKEQMQKIFDDISCLPLKVDRGQCALYIFNSSLGAFLQQFGKSFEKFVPDVIKEMSPNLTKIFLDAYILGDGSIRKSRTKWGINSNEERMYFTSSKRMADDIGELLLKIGKVPSFKFENTKGKLVKFKNGIYETKTDMWRIRETKSQNSHIKDMKVEEISYNKQVYCVELEKHHTLYVRRNGQCSWSGNCRCTWNIQKNYTGPTTSLSRKEESQIHGIENHINHAAKDGTLHTVKKDGKLSDRTRKTNPMKEIPNFQIIQMPPIHLDLPKRPKLSRIALQENIANLRSEFDWLTDDYISKARELSHESGGQLYLIRAAGETITDHRSEGETYRRKLSSEELNSMARTSIGKSMDINHQPEYETDATILDTEFDKKRKEIQMLVIERDPQINQAIDDGKITAVSINGGPPRSESIEPCDHECTTDSCELCLVPKGVVLGEIDGIGMTWVVTDPGGIYWNSHYVPSAEPGIKFTRIEVL